MPSVDVCDCGRTIEQPATGRRRRKCKVCSPPDRRNGERPPRAAVVALAAGVRERGPLEDAAYVELAAVGREASMRGLLYLGLCRQFEGGDLTGSQAVAMSARILEAQRAALEGAPRPGDAVDELQARRARARQA